MNQAANRKFAKVKQRLGNHLPKKNIVPKSIEEGGTDSLGKKIDRLETNGVPEWLGSGG